MVKHDHKRGGTHFPTPNFVISNLSPTPTHSLLPNQGHILVTQQHHSCVKQPKQQTWNTIKCVIILLTHDLHCLNKCGTQTNISSFP